MSSKMTCGARAALAALAVALCARAEQYGGGAMPQYGAADYERDYRVHSPDAPASLDYKYQEEPHGDSEKPAKLAEEGERWRKPSERAQRRLARDDTDEELELETKALESEARRGRRRRKRKGRGRRDESFHEQPPAPRRRPPLASHRPTRLDPHYLDSIDYRDDGNKYLEDNERMPSKETTVKVIGRKPRQRAFAPPPPESTLVKTKAHVFTEDEEVEKNLGPIRDELKDDLDYLSSEERERPAPPGRNRLLPVERERPTLPSADSESGSGSDNEEPMRDWRPPKPAGNYPEYTDYRSMKNVENIKNKLPTLLRRPTTTTTQRSARRFSAGYVRPWPGRRAGDLPAIPMETAQPPEPSAELSAEPTAEPSAAMPSSESLGEPASDVETPSSTTTTAAPAAMIIFTVVATTAPKDAYTPVAFVPAVNQSELSMADKSRLSIMKKAQMKESSGKVSTRKPPVLLHVTTRLMPTVVMVAPGTGDPWQRAREVVGDSPATLDKVKRLMRQKLVSGAKSIRDLTDNWDETVCDYIDVGMLESLPDAAPRAPPSAPLSLLACTCSLALLLVL